MTDDTQLDLFGKPVSRGKVTQASVDAELSALARTLPRDMRLGTSSWSFPGWAGLVYADRHSQSILASQGLEAYAMHPLLRAVGVDRTFYGPIDAPTFAAYASVVPADFRFLVKAHELCTLHRYPHHPRYGVNRGKDNRFFLDAAYASDVVVAPCVEGLGDKLGVILFQFSPQDALALGGSPGFVAALKPFLAALPRGPLYAVELRNAELFTPRYVAAIAELGVVHCINAHPTMLSVTKQAVAATTDKPVVIRWLLHDGFTYESARTAFAPFDAIKEPDLPTRRAIAELIANAQAGSFVIINNKAEGSAPLSAIALAKLAADIRSG